jgi:hypothetical protein
MKKKYLVRDGVNWVNGARVPTDRKIDLTDEEARFDLDHGRITPAAAKKIEPKTDGDA